jgi:hypothetical protein
MPDQCQPLFESRRPLRDETCVAEGCFGAMGILESGVLLLNDNNVLEQNMPLDRLSKAYSE